MDDAWNVKRKNKCMYAKIIVYGYLKYTKRSNKTQL